MSLGVYYYQTTPVAVVSTTLGSRLEFNLGIGRSDGIPESDSFFPELEKLYNALIR